MHLHVKQTMMMLCDRNVPITNLMFEDNLEKQIDSTKKINELGDSIMGRKPKKPFLVSRG